VNHITRADYTSNEAAAIRSILGAADLPADVAVLPAPTNDDAYAVIDIHVFDALTVGRAVQATFPELEWDEGLPLGTFRASARHGRHLIVVWCTVDSDEQVPA
jgi:hypothetical protein